MLVESESGAKTHGESGGEEHGSLGDFEKQRPTSDLDASWIITEKKNYCADIFRSFCYHSLK